MFEAHLLSCTRAHTHLFADVSFCLRAGETLLVTGPNGCGKSSLLRLLAGLATPAAGEVRWQGRLIQDTRIEFSQYLHYISHTNGIKLGLSVKENLLLASQLTRIPLQENLAIVLEPLSLTSFQHTLAKNLSAGQKRRIALARLLLFPKPLWILDEPLTALDTQTQTLFFAQLEKHVRAGGISIISSHHPIDIVAGTTQTLRLGAC